MRLTDAQYERVAPLLPTPRGRLRVPQRQVLDALFYMAKEGCTWRALPAEFGPWHTIYMRLNRWAKSGVLARMMSELQRDQLAVLALDALSLDSTIIKLHADGAGTLRKRGRQAIGRSQSVLVMDRALYRRRNEVERFFARLKLFRGVHVRDHKLDTVYLGIIHLACLHIMSR